MSKKHVKHAQKKKPEKITALALRPKPLPPALVLAPGLPSGPLPSAVQLGEEAVLGALGVAEIRLTKKEETILARPVDGKLVLIKPSGQPYLSHPAYTRWFNDAFGRLGWSIVPVGKAQYNGKTVVMPHMLYIHRTPAAFAYGEQEYYEKNREQSYGDAIEACTASALRRCAKRLGVGLELWDRDWLNAWMVNNAVRVTVNDRGESKERYRRKQDPPLRGEIAVRKGKQPQGAPPAGAPPAATDYRTFDDLTNAIDADYRHEDDGPKEATHPKENEPIEKEQIKRFWVIARKTKRTETEIRMWLKVVFGYDSTSQIKRKEYNTIMRTVEAPGPLPMREPGQEG
jgi:hypothetical protein